MKTTGKMERRGVRRRWIRALLCSTAFIGMNAVLATRAMAIDVASQADWNTAVVAVAAAGAGSTVSINFTSGFTLTSSLAPLQASNTGVIVDITGNSQTIDGASTYQGIQVDGANAPTVNISNLAVANTAAIGGNGQNGQAGYKTSPPGTSGLAYGSGGGGGGGLGAGGGLLVGSGANVTVSNVTFSGNSATGGAGGTGGSVQDIAPDPVNGGDGGVGGAANNGGASGGGGTGGNGGSTGTQGTPGTAGPGFGDGGGGGGGSGTTNSTSYTSNNPGGTGNASGGNGGPGGDGVFNNSGSGGSGADGGYGGNGGAAQGGAIYVATGGTLTILDTGISGAAATGGTGGSPGVGQGPSAFNGSAGGNGSAQGAGIFLSGVTATVGVTSGTQTYNNTVGGTGLTTSGVTTAINKTGAGTLVLGATNTFTGDINITAGAVSVAGTSQSWQRCQRPGDFGRWHPRRDRNHDPGKRPHFQHCWHVYPRHRHRHHDDAARCRRRRRIGGNSGERRRRNAAAVGGQHLYRWHQRHRWHAAAWQRRRHAYCQRPDGRNRRDPRCQRF